MMDDDIKYLRQRVDHIVDRLTRQDVLLEKHSILHEKNTLDLSEHIRRTALLESQMELALWPIRVSKVLIWVGGVITFFATLAYYWNEMGRP